jgi:phosphoglycolate phosphatase
LEALKNGGFCLALVTNKPRINTLRLIQQLDLDRFFSVIVAGDDTPNPKPAPDILMVAMTQLGLAPQECIMIGDSMNDALAAQNANTACVLLETGYNEGIGIAEWAQIHAPKAKVFATLKDAVPFFKKTTR